MSLILFRLLLFILIIYLLKKFLAALYRYSKRTEIGNYNSAGPSNQMVKDPVCGMYMDPRLAVRLDGRNGTFYFCSEGCKKKFLDISSESGISSAAS